MNKTATATWPELLLGSGAVGAGTFALGRLLQELQQGNPGGVAAPETLTLDLPVRKKPTPEQQAAALSPVGMKMANDAVLNLAATLGGAPLGYMGTKFLYDQIKKHEMKQKVEQANQSYLQALQAAQQGKIAAADEGSSTPLVDQMCAAVAHEVEKHAGLLDKAKSFLNPRNLLYGGAGSAALAAPGVYSGIKQMLNANQTGGFAPVSDTVNKATDWTKVVAALGSLLVGGGMIHAATKRQDKDARRLPTGVAINHPEVDAVNPAIA